MNGMATVTASSHAIRLVRAKGRHPRTARGSSCCNSSGWHQLSLNGGPKGGGASALAGTGSTQGGASDWQPATAQALAGTKTKRRCVGVSRGMKMEG